MKKIVFIFLFAFLSVYSFANINDFSQIVEQKNEQAAYHHFVAKQLQQETRNGNVAKLKSWLKQSDKSVWVQRDPYGNNLFHLCRNEETFYVLWTFLVSVRDEMLRQQNKAGEIPWVTYIMYGKEDIFLKYFPKSSLYIRLQEATQSMNDKGINSAVAKIKRDELIKECSVGGQTMWQRANLMVQAQASGMSKGFVSYGYSSKISAGDRNFPVLKRKMEMIREMIEQTAPFLKR